MVLASALCVIPLFSAAQTEEVDRYSIGLIRSALSLHAQGVHTSVIEKNIPRCGDLTAIALTKIYGEAELLDPKTVTSMLPIIKQSFSQPQFISDDIDRKPNITLILLRYLQQNVPDAQVQRDIEETIRFVREKTTT
jgi:hypothetical protein